MERLEGLYGVETTPYDRNCRDHGGCKCR
jgi:hypothetical protein